MALRHPQEALPIMFLLIGAGIPLPVPFNAAIRPEGITISRLARGSVVHTAGAPFLDDYGQGIPQLLIQGHTGYMPELFAPLRGLPFFELLQLAFTQYLNRRETLKRQNQDPDAVRLEYYDLVNVQAFSCYPVEFVLERTRARPMLYLYRIRAAVLEDYLFGS